MKKLTLLSLVVGLTATCAIAQESPEIKLPALAPAPAAAPAITSAEHSPASGTTKHAKRHRKGHKKRTSGTTAPGSTHP